MSNIYSFGQLCRLGVLSTDPSDPENGSLYYNSTSNTFRVYKNNGWQGLQDADPDLNALAALSTTGIAARTAANTWTTRTITATTPISISNGNATAGNPAITHATSGVSAGSVGSSTQIPTITVNATGHVTSILQQNLQVTYQTVTSTTAISTTSGTMAVMTDMTLTPPSGTYLILFSGNVWCTGGGNASGDVAIYANNAAVTGALREVEIVVAMALGLIGTATVKPAAGLLVGIAAVNGSQAIDVRYNRSNGTVHGGDRSLTVIRLKD